MLYSLCVLPLHSLFHRWMVQFPSPCRMFVAFIIGFHRAALRGGSYEYFSSAHPTVARSFPLTGVTDKNLQLLPLHHLISRSTPTRLHRLDVSSLSEFLRSARVGHTDSSSRCSDSYSPQRRMKFKFHTQTTERRFTPRCALQRANEL